jgi:hypothetical protein
MPEEMSDVDDEKDIISRISVKERKRDGGTF